VVLSVFLPALGFMDSPPLVLPPQDRNEPVKPFYLNLKSATLKSHRLVSEVNLLLT
jgi:hypothetical protein